MSQKKKKNVSWDTFACPEKKDVDTRYLAPPHAGVGRPLLSVVDWCHFIGE